MTDICPSPDAIAVEAAEVDSEEELMGLGTVVLAKCSLMEAIEVEEPI